VDKASSLIEAEDESVTESLDGSVSGTRPRAIKPIESGVFSGLSAPVSSESLVDNLQSALSAASRGEAGLGSLHRSLRDASRALTASRHSHQSLTDELRVLHRGLNEVMSEKAAVERYATLLTQERDAALDAAEEARREARREREFLLREQDRFIQLLLEEHEAELQRLRLRIDETDVPSDERKTLPPVTPAAEEAPTAPSLSSATLARVQLASADWGSSRPSAGRSERAQRAVPMPESHAPGERPPTYPPPPAVLDLDSLAAEVDGNSERPPPIRRLTSESSLHLKPARVPTQLMDTLVSNPGVSNPGVSNPGDSNPGGVGASGSKK
jgi:hypothetical protein